jgi:hypothetical protein
MSTDKKVSIYKLYSTDRPSALEYYLHRKDTDWAKHCIDRGNVIVEKIKVSKQGTRYAEAVKSSKDPHDCPCCSDYEDEDD